MIAVLLALASQAASDKLPKAQALPPPTGEEQAVLGAANGLLAAFNTGNAAEILRWVYPEGRVTGTGTLPGRSGLHSESWTQFTQTEAGSPFQETISDPAVEVDGDAAISRLLPCHGHPAWSFGAAPGARAHRLVPIAAFRPNWDDACPA